jgi:hypothetical protein
VVAPGCSCVDPTVALRQDVERLRGSLSPWSSRRASSGGSSATSTMVPSSGWSRRRSTWGLAEDRPGSYRTPPASWSPTPRSRRASRSRSCATSCGGRHHRSCSTAARRCSGRGGGNPPVPTTVDSRLADGERLPASGERAAYFVVAESLANVAKHGASHAAVTLRTDAGGRGVVPGGSAAGPDFGGPEGRPQARPRPKPGLGRGPRAQARPRRRLTGSAAPASPGDPAGARASTGPWAPMWPGAGAGWRPTVSGPSERDPAGWPRPVRARRLVVEVRDDGAGGAMVTAGGLAGLRDRVEALDGSLALSSPPGWSDSLSGSRSRSRRRGRHRRLVGGRVGGRSAGPVRVLPLNPSGRTVRACGRRPNRMARSGQPDRRAATPARRRPRHRGARSSHPRAARACHRRRARARVAGSAASTCRRGRHRRGGIEQYVTERRPNLPRFKCSKLWTNQGFLCKGAVHAS